MPIATSDGNLYQDEFDFINDTPAQQDIPKITVTPPEESDKEPSFNKKDNIPVIGPNSQGEDSSPSKGKVTWDDVGAALKRDFSRLGDNIINALTQGPKLLERAYKGEIDLNSEEGIKEVTDIAMNFGMAGLATAPLRPGVGIFGGRINKQIVDLADKMELEGFSPYTVKEFTGLERGTEGMWRREISDHDASLKPDTPWEVVKDLDGSELYGTFLGDALNHPELFTIYPEAARVPVYVDPKLQGTNTRGAFNIEAGYIRLNPDNSMEQMLSTLMHEVQHYIQKTEGFSLAVPMDVPKEIADAVKKEYILAIEQGNLRSIKKLIDAYFVEYADSPTAKTLLLEDMRAIAKGILRNADNTVYRRLASETEARNVQTRLGYSRKDRRKSLASETEDVYRHKQLIPDKPVLDN